VNLSKLSKEELIQEIEKLKNEVKILKTKSFEPSRPETVHVPDQIKPIFDIAEKTVGEYFKSLKTDPSTATIEIANQRYVLVRASTLSFEFLNTIKNLYADRGEKEAISIGKNFLFDISHVIGINDARNFHQRMNLTDPIAKLSAGPVHFAYSGWAFVDILPESSPTPDDNFFLIYNHPFSFESDSWIRSGKTSDFPVCIMNAGYSSGWCEESFGIPLTSVEISCKAKGDENCTFIMAPPHKIKDHLEKYHKENITGPIKKMSYEIPTFFERKKIEEEKEKARKNAEESDRAKTEFLANMSHELRTPLNAVIGYIDVLLKEKMNPEHHEYLVIVKESSKILQNLTNDILDLSKIEANQIVIEKIPVSLKKFMNSLDSLANTLVNQSGKPLEIRKKVPEDVSLYIKTDPTRLQQIMSNLISNAIKFTNTGFIEFGCELKNFDTLEFYVKDSGIGIPLQNQKKVFDMFVQADSTTTRMHGGSGLGLTISKKLVELMGGELWLESEENKGSKFYFTHPYLPGTFVEDLQDFEPKPDIDKVIKPVILLAEDNLTNQRLTKLILQKSGMSVVTANNGKEALEIYQSGLHIDLIVMDIQMPVMDGLTAITEIRHFEKNNLMHAVPIIALTADAMKEDVDKCVKAGCDTYLTKPIISDLLISSIQNELKKK